ncbi:MAG: group II intron reverse transcriptase domain-containing protein [Candidatus Yanofskybacteria bacterium]|nr:group II intron reverse transcriptase domain-containing protein [Candidatus Yanofskybacteria bacterium]
MMSYRHYGYEAFNISDPKPRNIHKASVRNRVLHRALYRILYPFFDRTFISDSYSCRYDKATYKAMDKFLRKFFFKVSENNKKTVWVLKCDIRKFFASVNHDTLKAILKSYVPDDKVLSLLWVIIDSFSVRTGTGLPLGNFTSQLFVNIYMNEFDQFVKHKLKAKYYIRYADDFVVLSQDKAWLEEMLPKMGGLSSREIKIKSASRQGFHQNPRFRN